MRIMLFRTSHGQADRRRRAHPIGQRRLLDRAGDIHTTHGVAQNHLGLQPLLDVARHVRGLSAEGNTVARNKAAMPERKPATCQPVKAQDFIAAPPVEKSKAAAITAKRAARALPLTLASPLPPGPRPLM